VSTNALLAGIVSIGDPYSLHLGFEISTPDRSPDPKIFATPTPDAVWHLTIGEHYRRIFSAGTSFALTELPGGVPQFEVRNFNPVTLRGAEFPAGSVSALRIGGITLDEPYPSGYRLGTVLYADYNAPGSSVSRFMIGEFPDPAFVGTIEHISLAPYYLFSPVPETGTFALGGLTLAAAAAILRIRRRRKLGC
jgi:MYXO-CTERM domain-containing protein